MKYYFIYQVDLGRRRIVAKRHRLAIEMKTIMKFFPDAEYGEVDAVTYSQMKVGDEW